MFQTVLGYGQNCEGGTQLPGVPKPPRWSVRLKTNLIASQVALCPVRNFFLLVILEVASNKNQFLIL